MLNKIAAALADLDGDELLVLVRRALESSTPPIEVLQACQDGMTVAGRRYEAGDYFVSELMLAAESFREVNEILQPHLAAGVGPSLGKVVIGTVRGDVHDVGKDIVASMLRSARLAVTDLGVDVPPGRFVQAVREEKAGIVGISGLLTTSFEPMRETVAALAQAGLRERVRVMIGGATLDGETCEEVGADAWGRDALEAVRIATEWADA